MDLMVKDLEALRKHLDLSEWTILGHSFGGILANYYTSKYSERVSGLIASSSGGVDLGLLDYFDINQQLTPAEGDSLTYWTAKVNEGDTTAYTDQKRREFFAAAYVYDDRHIPEIAERLSQSNPTINGLIWNDLQRIQYDVSEELSGFTKPVLIIQGKQDILRESTARKALNVFPYAELVLLERCGHYGWLDQPEQYFEYIFSFRDKLKPIEMEHKQIIKSYYRSYKEADKEILQKVLTADFRHISQFTIYTNRDEMIGEIWPEVGKSWAEDLQIFGIYPEYLVRYKVVGGDRPARNMAEYICFEGDKIAEIEVFIGRELE